MQMQKRFSIFLLLITVITSGMFGFVTPKKALASAMEQHVNAHAMPESNTMSCSQNGCVDTHMTCASHCMDQSSKESTTPFITPSSSQIITNHVTTNILEKPVGDSLLFAPFNQEPPSYIFLRSVIKRE